MRASGWRERWPWIAVGVVALLVALVFGARAWIRGQDYLERGAAFRNPDGATVRESLALVEYRDGAPMRFGFSVRNDGRFTVRVTEVAPPEPPGDTVFMFRPTATRMAAAENVPGGDAPVPFRPFSLKPGHERYVEVVGVLGDCEYWEARSSQTISAQQVRFEVLEQSLTEAIPLASMIEIRLRSRAACPRPHVRD